MCQRFLASRAVMPETYESENIDNQLSWQIGECRARHSGVES